MTTNKSLIIDGDNVLYHKSLHHEKKLEKNQIMNLQLMIEFCESKGFDVLVFISARTKYFIENRTLFECLIEKGIFHETPAGIDSDLYILETAKVLNSYIISNDLFRE